MEDIGMVDVYLRVSVRVYRMSGGSSHIQEVCVGQR